MANMNRMVIWNTGSLIGLLFRYVTIIIHNEYIWIFFIHRYCSTSQNLQNKKVVLILSETMIYVTIDFTLR